MFTKIHTTYYAPLFRETTPDRSPFYFSPHDGYLYLSGTHPAERYRQWAQGFAREVFDAGAGQWVEKSGMEEVPLLNHVNKKIVRLLSAPDKKHVVTHSRQYGLEMFAALIPARVRSVAARFVYLQMPMLRCAAISREARQLFLSNPALFWLAVEYAVRESLPADSIAGLFRMKRREILGVATGYESERAVHLLEKVTFAEAGKIQFNALCAVLLDPGAPECLAHVPSISCDLVVALSMAPNLLRHRALGSVLSASALPSTIEKYEQVITEMTGTAGPYANEIALCRNGGDLDALLERVKWRTQLLAEISDLARVAGGECPDRIMMEGMSLQELDAIHDRFAAEVSIKKEPEYLEKVKREAGTLQFPLPPLPQGNGIAPVTSPSKLFREGIEMHNCVASYAFRIINRQCYIYSMRIPVRATVEIVLKPGCGPALGDIRCPFNRRPPEDVVEVARKWVEKAGNRAGGKERVEVTEVGKIDEETMYIINR